MADTMLVGDYVFVSHLGVRSTGSLSFGDVVVFQYPVDERQMLVKRVVGLPGDHIRMVNKQLYLNGRTVNEPYVKHSSSYADSYRDNFPSGPPNSPLPPSAHDMLDNHVMNGELVVPPDRIFVLGDNRDDSADSRYWGLVPPENVSGRASVILWSIDVLSSDLTSPDRGFDIRSNITQARWSRLFRAVR
jgi:signal peptidase I